MPSAVRRPAAGPESIFDPRIGRKMEANSRSLLAHFLEDRLFDRCFDSLIHRWRRRDRRCVPDIVGVVPDGAVCGKTACFGNIDQAHLVPTALILKELYSAVL